MSNFGMLPEIESLRVYDYEKIHKSTKGTLPDTFTISKERIPTVRDQYDINACVGFSIAEIIESLHKIETGESQTFSGGYPYGKLRDPSSRIQGMFVSQALKHWIKYGSVPTTIFDELYEMPEMKELVEKRPDLDTIAERFRIKSFFKIGDEDINVRNELICNALYEHNYPLLAASDTYFGGGHAFIIIGYDKIKKNFIMQNSWGNSWKNKGVGTIPFNRVDDVWLITDQTFEMPFEDVGEDKWYYDSVKQCYASGLINGTSATTFEPDRPVTRAELCAIMDRHSKMIDNRFERVMTAITNAMQKKE